MNQNRYVIAGILTLIALFGLGFYLNRNKSELGDGKVTENSTTPAVMGTTNQPIPGRPQVTLNTAKGKITLELRPDLAPKTVANFLAKFNTGYCNGLTFHRVEDWVVQGCDPKGDGTGGQDSLPTEPSSTASASFTTGALGVARKQNPKDISNDSQFFIVKKDSTFLNGEYTYFGHVIAGMDVVAQLAAGDKIGETNVLTK